MNHLMLDLETWGTAPGSALRSIGAVFFDLDGKTGETFYRNIDKASCLDAGLTIDPSTVSWWSRQSAAAQRALEVDQMPLRNVVFDFHSWAAKAGRIRVWSQGAAFDTVLWDFAARAAGYPSVPWKFWDTRDTRTVYDLFGFDARDLPRDGTYHNALDDAVYQVKCVAAALSKGRASFPFQTQWAEAVPENGWSGQDEMGAFS
jgi:hypothetical protein